MSDVTAEMPVRRTQLLSWSRSQLGGRGQRPCVSRPRPRLSARGGVQGRRGKVRLSEHAKASKTGFERHGKFLIIAGKRGREGVSSVGGTVELWDASELLCLGIMRGSG